MRKTKQAEGPENDPSGDPEDEGKVRLSRRRMLALSVGVPLASAASAEVIRRQMPWQEGVADHPQTPPRQDGGGNVFFTSAEAGFISAAVARLIPADDLGPGAVEAGAVEFIDRQLAGEFGRAQRWYMQGPWGEGESTQGYQSRHTPASLYRAAIREIEKNVSDAHQGAGFSQLSSDEQDKWLRRLENGDIELQTVDAKTFFQMLLQNTQQGFWCDPMYGGNRDMVGWKLIGFPGARYDHRPFVDKHGEPYPLPPVGLHGRPEWIAQEK